MTITTVQIQETNITVSEANDVTTVTIDDNSTVNTIVVTGGRGPQGTDGSAGEASNVPAGGTTNQALLKTSNTDFDMNWGDVLQSADIGLTVQAHSAVLDGTTASFTTAEETKLSNIETAATADQTGSEIKAAYEGEANAFTDAQFTKLSGIATGANVNTVTSVNTQTGAVILTADDIDDTSTNNAFTTPGDIGKLSAIENGATADQTGSEIKAAYEGEANAFTDAQFTKLSNIETAATADQTAAEILAALITVDGTTSALDADLLDGQHGTHYLDYNNFANTPTIPSSTSDISEGSNLYHTNERVDDRVSNLLVAGTNITITYDDVANSLTFNATAGSSQTNWQEEGSAVVGSSTANFVGSDVTVTNVGGVATITIADGYTSSDFDTDFGTKTTAGLTEATNLYYTDTRANSAIDARVDTAFVTATGALMDSELTSITNVKALDQSVVSGSSPTFDIGNITIDDTNLVIADTTNLQNYIDGVDAALLRARGTGFTSTYVSTVAIGGTTFAQPAVNGEISSDEGYFSIAYAGATNITIATLTASSTYVYIDKAGNLQQQTTIPTRQDWSRKMFTMRIAVNTSTQTILGFEYLNNPIGHYANSIRDLYGFMLAQGLPFKKDQIVTGRASDLGFDVSAGSLMEFGGTGDIDNANIKSFVAIANATYSLLTKTTIVGDRTDLQKSWDNAGTITALGSTTVVGHRLYRFSNGAFAIQYGQGNYANIILARAGVLLENYELNPLLTNATFLGWWLIEETATNTGGTTLTDFREYTIGVQGGSSSGLSGCLLRGNNLSDLLDVGAAQVSLDLEPGVDVQAYSSVLANTTASFTTAEETKLSGIETAATADQTGSEIEAIVNHDNLIGFVANEHIDWSATNAADIHPDNYTDTNTTYTVGDGGLTEINFTSADNTKLDGMETSATADQTAAEILAAMLTVDGTASGLDADLLDGQQGTHYLDYNNFANTPTIPSSTSDISEGTNLYFTSERVDDRVDSLLTAGTNITLTYDDTAGTLTINSSGSGGGGGGSVAVDDEGSQLIAAASRLNFAGAGVTVTDAGSNEATITIPGAASLPLRSIAQYTSTSTPDVNNTTPLVVPFSNALITSSDYSNSSGTVTVATTGTYRVNAVISYTSNVQRASVALQIYVNGTATDRITYGGYLRAASGHNEASNYIEEFLELTANDTVEIYAFEGAASGTATLIANESILMFEKVSENVAVTISNNIVGTLDGGGNTITDVNLENYKETNFALSYAATITPDVANGNVQTITLTGDTTFSAFTNPEAGQSMTVIIKQDATGSRTLTSTMLFAGAEKTLTTDANGIDIMSVFYDGTTYYASLAKGFA